MTGGGYYKAFRSMFTSQLFVEAKPYCIGFAWHYLLGHAAFCDTVQTVGKYEVEVSIGQFAYRRLDLVFAFGWNEAQVKYFLKRLIENEMITVNYFRNKYSVMTITNYHIYQGGYDDMKTDGKSDFPSNSPSNSPSERQSKPMRNKPVTNSVYPSSYPSSSPSSSPSNSALNDVNSLEVLKDGYDFATLYSYLRTNKNNNNINIYLLKNTKNLNQIQEKILKFEKNISNSKELAEKYLSERIESRWKDKQGKKIIDLASDLFSFLLHNGFSQLFKVYKNGNYPD